MVASLLYRYILDALKAKKFRKNKNLSRRFFLRLVYVLFFVGLFLVLLKFVLFL